MVVGGAPRPPDRGLPLKLKSPIANRVLAGVFTTAMRLIFRTLRLEMRTAVPGTNPYAAAGVERYVYCVWHDSIVMPTFGGRHEHTVALTSRHADGSFVEQVLKLNSISSIRGSTNRITPGALRSLLRCLGQNHLVVTPDGPRGPARQISPGITFLASRSGRAIVPTAFICSRPWRFRGTWCDLIVPKPFSRVLFLAGEPMHVPAHASAAELQHHAELLQQRMDLLNENAAESLQAPRPRAA